MAKERRDKKNRILGKGEYQKADGRYMYRYTDASGNQKFVYSWTLTNSDRAPKGKESNKCLRDLEKEISQSLLEKIDFTSAETNTLNYYFEQYMSLKRGLEDSTRRNYRLNYNSYVAGVLGNRKIADIKYTDVKQLYVDLMFNNDLSLATVNNIHIILNPVFKLAVRDNCIRSNPAEGIMSELKREYNNIPQKRHPLTVTEQEAFVEYVRMNRKYFHWLPIITFLLGTGCRVGEMAGLTWDDVDFENGVIKINKTLMYYPDEYTGKSKFSISEPKTSAGNREIPMFLGVRKMLIDEKQYQTRFGFCKSVIDGYSNFVFVNRSGEPYAPKNINAALKRITNSYNQNECELAKIENREPVLLPYFTAHNLRHTFCTRMCENKVDLKVLQEIMGHSSISITMDIYNEATIDHKRHSFANIEGKMKIC